MKKFKKRKNLFNPETGRIVFEEIIHDIFSKYQDSIVCNEETMQKLISDIAQKVREQLKLI